MLAAALLMIVPGMAAAQAVKDKPQVALDASTAYVMYRSAAAAPLELVRDATPEDIAAYQAKRTKAFEKAHRKYLNLLNDWQGRADLHRGNATFADPGPQPVEPSEANFAFAPIELDLIVAMGPMDRFSKANGESVYLQAVPAGNYRVYGPITFDSDAGTVGVCMCMGTVQFRAEVGMITNLGALRFPFLEAIKQAKSSGGVRPRTALDLPDGKTSMMIEPAVAGAPVDSRIGHYPVKPATYRPAGKMPNWYGIEVDRLSAMPEVISYDRDRIVDLTAPPEAGSH